MDGNSTRDIASCQECGVSCLPKDTCFDSAKKMEIEEVSVDLRSKVGANNGDDLSV